MRILVLGSDGMLGHQLIATLRNRHEVAGTVRLSSSSYSAYEKHLPGKLFDCVDVRDFSVLEGVIEEFRPEAVINAVGIVKQRNEANSAIESLEINSLIPHRLSKVCVPKGIRLFHMSTDCVFSGAVGNYHDDALPDARDMYGRSKMMGEVSGDGVVTLRTSIIGLELTRKTSLIEWFLRQSGEIRGFTKAIYSGFTTIEMARVIERLLVRFPGASGIYNVSSKPIDKYSLLVGLRDRLGKVVEIVPDDTFVCDRSLDSTRFQDEFGYDAPSWDAMLDELAAQVTHRVPRVSET